MCEFQRRLAGTDADLSIQSVVYAYVNEHKELVIEFDLEDDDFPSRNFTRRAIVDSEDTLEMARYYRVGVDGLPRFLFDECGVGYDTTTSHVEEIFQESLNLILDSGARYKFREL